MISPAAPPLSVRVLSVVIAAQLVAGAALGAYRVTEPADEAPRRDVAAATTTTTTSSTTTLPDALPTPESGIGGTTTTVAGTTGAGGRTGTGGVATTAPTRSQAATTTTRRPAPTGVTAQTDAGIYTVDPDGKSLRRVRSGGFNFLSWSPSGARLAYGPRAQVMNADGSGITTLLPGLLVAPPAWSPDATRLALVVQNSGRSDLVVVGADGSGARGLTTRGDVSGAAWSSTGVIAFLAGGQVFVVNPDGSGLRQLVESDRAYRALAWSPDGRWLAFANGREIWITDIHANGRVLSSADGNIPKWSDITWAPDSTRVAFQAGTGGAERIVVIGHDGTGRRTIAEGALSPDWSPTRTDRLAIFSAGKALGGGDRINDVELANPNRSSYRYRVVTDQTGAFQSSGPEYSADGNLLAFALGGSDSGGPPAPTP